LSLGFFGGGVLEITSTDMSFTTTVCPFRPCRVTTT